MAKNKVKKINYLGEVIQLSRSEKEANQMRIQVKTVLHLTRNLHTRNQSQQQQNYDITTL